MIKLLENTFRAVNIGLVNEISLMCDRLGLDAWEVIDGAATKPFGFMRFYPGPGIGGHCIPLDPHYLSWKLKALNYTARYIELASEINTAVPRHWVHKVQDALNEEGKAVKGSRVLVLGVAYKKDVSDLRESPALDILMLLQEKGARVMYHDPHVPKFPRMRKYDIQLDSIALTDDAVGACDSVLIVTDHADVDYGLLGRSAKLIVDTRNAMDRVEGIALPCLVVHGVDDALIPVDAGREIAALIPGAELEIIDGMGHVITPTLAPLIVDRVDRFVRG